MRMGTIYTSYMGMLIVGPSSGHDKIHHILLYVTKSHDIESRRQERLHKLASGAEAKLPTNVNS